MKICPMRNALENYPIPDFRQCAKLAMADLQTGYNQFDYIMAFSRLDFRFHTFIRVRLFPRVFRGNEHPKVHYLHQASDTQVIYSLNKVRRIAA